MTPPPARPLAAIEEDLRSCRVIRLGAERELVHVRRRMAELVDVEAVLVATVENRRDQADRLLDERLLAAAAGGARSPAQPSPGRRALSEQRDTELVEPGRG